MDTNARSVNQKMITDVLVTMDLSYETVQDTTLVGFSNDDDSPLLRLHLSACNEITPDGFGRVGLVAVLPHEYGWEQWPMMLATLNEWNVTRPFPSTRLRFNEDGKTAIVTAELHVPVVSGTYPAQLQEWIATSITGAMALRDFLEEHATHSSPSESASRAHDGELDRNEAQALRELLEEILEELPSSGP